MDENRKFALTSGIGVLIIFIILAVVGEKTSTFYWGIPIGIVFGIVTCIYLSKAWDPYLLEPTNAKIAKTSWRIVWVVPFAIVAAKMTSKFPEGSAEQYLTELSTGAGTTWIFIALSYIIIQAWRYRPKKR